MASPWTVDRPAAPAKLRKTGIVELFWNPKSGISNNEQFRVFDIIVKPLLINLIVTAVLAATAAGASAQQRLYRWVDNEGVVHYGDRVPPEFANRDRDVLNDQAVTIGSEEGEVTAEERAEIARRQAADAERQAARNDEARRDRMLLETYLTVADIEDLRDRRLELIGSQIKVTELYLTNLHKRIVALEREASPYSPYSDKEDAAPVPDDLATEIRRTRASIALYEQTLERSRSEQEALRSAFELDIIRFKELKGV